MWITFKVWKDRVTFERQTLRDFSNGKENREKKGVSHRNEIFFETTSQDEGLIQMWVILSSPVLGILEGIKVIYKE